MIEKTILEGMVSQGLSANEMANELGVCLSLIYQALRKHSLRTQYAPLVVEQLVLEELIAEGLSTREMADRLGRCQFVVCYYMKKYGLKTKRKRNIKQGYCTTCGETDKNAFYTPRYSECKTCMKKYGQDRRHALKREFVDYKGGCCELCGYNKCLASLHFHHLDKTTKDPKWTNLLNKSLEQVKAELDKCQLVCANCHGEMHYADGYG